MQHYNEFFNQHWKIYQKVLASNAMFHHEFAGYFRDVMGQSGAVKPMDMLDLGCGDAGHISEVLSGMNVGSYTGYDLSGQALELAQERLNTLVPRYDLHCGPMEEIITREARTFDIVYSGYAIHHLTDIAKADFIKQVYRVLKPGGLFFLVDVYRPDDQPVEAYISGMTSWIQSTWTFLDPEERHMICDHIRGFDQPASYADFGNWAKTSGFDVGGLPGGDVRHRAMLLTRPVSSKN